MSFHLLVCAKTEQQIDIHLKGCSCVVICQRERLFVRLQFSVLNEIVPLLHLKPPQNLFYVILLCLVMLLAEFFFLFRVVCIKYQK
jgi:hypothetical protein